MALEDLTGAGKFITALVPGNPVSTDDRREGDDHIRGIKNVLRNSFPNVDGQVVWSAAGMNDALQKGQGSVQKAGDTMTGPLTVSGAAAHYYLQATGAPVNRRNWDLVAGTTGDFSILRFDDAGGAQNTTAFAFVQSLNRWCIGGIPIATTALLQALELRVQILEAHVAALEDRP